MGRSRIARQAIVACATSVGLVAALLVAVLVSVGAARAASEEGRHRERTLIAIERVERHVGELSNGLSGYATTGRPALLLRWHVAGEALEPAVAEVARLTDGDPGERQATIALRTRVARLLEAHRRPGALSRIASSRRERRRTTGEARRAVPGIRAALAGLRRTERAQAARGRATRERASDRALVIGAVGLVASVALIAGLGLYVLRRIVMPIRALVPAAARLATGDFAARVEPSGHPEVRRVGDAFNAMAGQIDRDRHALEQALEEVRHLADHDPLTGLLNRRALERELSHHCGRTSRYGADGAVILLDVDGFKTVNDTFGHATGDAVIVWIAELLRSRLRRSDQVGRLGGDEFAILLPTGNAADAERVARSLVDGVRAGAGAPAPVTISAGIAVAAAVSVPGRDELLAAADRAMYAVKAAGRDGYAIAPAPQAAATSAANASTS